MASPVRTHIENIGGATARPTACTMFRRIISGTRSYHWQKRCQRDKSSPWLATPARWTRSGSTRILFMARMCRLPQTWTTFSAGFLIRKVLRSNTFCNTFLFLAPCLRFPSRRSGFRNLTKVRWICMPGFRRKSSGPGSTPVGGIKIPQAYAWGIFYVRRTLDRRARPSADGNRPGGCCLVREECLQVLLVSGAPRH